MRRLAGDERIARLAHELNAPVSLIAGSLQNLDQALASIRRFIAATTGHRGADPDLERVYRQEQVESELAAAVDLLAICREGVDRIHYLSNAFGLTGERHRPSREAGLDAGALIRRSVAFATAARPVDAEIELDLAETPTVEGDREDLSAALINLVVNALDAVAGLSDGRVTITLRHDESRQVVEARVRDNGRGVHPCQVERIFEPFRTTKSTGSGLGLAIAREALERHGGRIELASPDGGGAEFVLSLPARPRGKRE